MTGIDGNMERLKLFGKSGTQHTAGLFGLPVSLVVIIDSAGKLQIIKIQTASPVAGNIDDTRGRRRF